MALTPSEPLRSTPNPTTPGDAYSAGWEGRVVYVALLRTEGWVSVEEWLPADRLAPAE